MSTSMKAAFTLTLEDKLSSGLNDIKKGFDELRNKGKQLNLGKLEREDLLGALRREVKSLTSDLRGIETAADRGSSALHRMASTKMQGLRGFTEKLFGKKGVEGPGHEVKQHGQIGAISGLVSGYSLIQPTQAYADYQNLALQSAVTKGLSGKPAEIEANRLMAVFNKDALATGQSGTSISEAYRDLIQAGFAPERAEALLPFHARAGTAYNVSAESLGHSMYAMANTLKIDDADMPGALASMALASKSGLFKMPDFNDHLSGIAGSMAVLGMTGRKAADQIFADLEIASRAAKDPAQASANLTDFIGALTAPHSARTFALHNRMMAPQTRAVLNKYHVTGIDLPKLLEHAHETHTDPVVAVLKELQKKTAGLPDYARGEVLGAMIPNQQSRQAAVAMLLYADDMKRLADRLNAADTPMLTRDFNTQANSPKVQLNMGEEAAAQIDRQVGKGFDVIINPMISGLKSAAGGLGEIDAKFPGLTDAVLAVTGSLLALGAALAGIGFAAPAVVAGWGLLGTGLTMGGGALATGAAALPFVTLAALPWIAKAGSDNETPENRAALDKLAAEQRSQEGGPNGTLHDGYGPDGAPIITDISDHRQAQPHQLEITLHADQGTSLEVTRSTPGFSFTIPNAGQTTNRP